MLSSLKSEENKKALISLVRKTEKNYPSQYLKNQCFVL